MKKFSCLIVGVFSLSVLHGQITKGNWMVGGNASFTKTDYATAVSGQYKRTDLLIAAPIGHFLIDKFAVGITPSLVYGKTVLSTNTGSGTVFKIGPFVRYYFLKPDQQFNLFAEGSYAYGTSSAKQGQHTYTAKAGPVLYFNSSVGLEFTVAHSTTKFVGVEGRDNLLQFGIDFQIHLEK